MSIMTILKIFGPVIVTFLQGIFDRIFKHGVSSIQGTAAGAGVIALAQQICPGISLSQQAIMGSIAALPGLIGTDAKQIAPSLVQAASQAVKDAQNDKRERPKDEQA